MRVVTKEQKRLVDEALLAQPDRAEVADESDDLDTARGIAVGVLLGLVGWAAIIACGVLIAYALT